MIDAFLMPDPSNRVTSFDFNFTLPRDYAPGTNVYIRVLWRTDTAFCAVNLTHNSLSLIEPGQISRIGVVAREGGLMQASSTQHVVNETNYRLSFYPYTDLVAGDAIVGGLHRVDIDDTCGGNLCIQGLSVVYEGRTEGIFRNGFEVL